MAARRSCQGLASYSSSSSSSTNDCELQLPQWSAVRFPFPTGLDAQDLIGRLKQRYFRSAVSPDGSYLISLGIMVSLGRSWPETAGSYVQWPDAHLSRLTYKIANVI